MCAAVLRLSKAKSGAQKAQTAKVEQNLIKKEANKKARTRVLELEF